MFCKSNNFKLYHNIALVCTYGGTLYGFLLGFNEFKSSSTPIYNLICRILNHTFDGILIGLTWPITFTLTPLIFIDKYLKINK